MQALYIFVVSLLLTLSYRGEATGSVFFVDGSNNQYLRPPSDQALPMSLSEVSAAVSALLGFSPPATLTPDGSFKLNKILKPNPFERPRAAFVLEIAGADDALVETLPSHSFLGNAVRGSISSDSDNAAIELPESGVAVMSANGPSSDVTDKDMNEFASWLGGSYVAGSAEPLTGLLSIPLSGGANVDFHLEKEAARKFASNLLALYKNIRGVVNLREDLSHAELTVGRFGGIDALAQEYGQGMAKQGMDVLLATLSKLFNLLETSHKGQIVGVIVLDERVNQESAYLLTVGSSSGSSARSMAEVEGVPSGAIMAFFDLNVPYSYPSQSGGKEAAVAVANKLRVKLATKAMELGYVGIAHNHSIGGVMTEKDSCTIPLLTLGSLIKAAPRLSSSVAFHRDLLGVPRSTPFRQYTRATVKLESKAQCLGLNSGNPVLKSYDIVAVRPMNQYAFDQACTKAEVDIISIDFSNLPFRLMHPTVKAAIKRGVYFEIKYSDLLKDAEKRRQVISNAKLLVDWTKGKNLIISSGSPSVTELRGPNDVINLMSLLGLSTERARAAVSKNCRNMIAKILKKKRFHKEAVKVELLSSSDTFSLEQTLSGDFMKWDPISSGEGDMLLEDLAKAFDATTRAVANKSSKAIDVTSDRKGLPSHGFRLTDILGSEPSTQETADKMIDDAPVHCKSQVSDACMADSASSVDNLLENETVSQIEISEDDNKVEPTTIVPLRKCSTSQGQGLLVQDQAAASFTLIRCTKSDAASDGNMQTELESEDKSVSPSKIGHVVPQSLVENLNMETILVHDEVLLDRVSKEEVISGHAKIEHSVSIDGDEMEIDGSLEVNHDQYVEVTVEDQKHETDNSLSPEAAGQDHDQVPSLDSSEAELGEEPAVPYNNTIEISMEDKKESGREIETNQQVHVQSERNNVRNSGKTRAKRSRTRLTQLQPLKPFLLHRFKQISKRRKHRRG